MPAKHPEPLEDIHVKILAADNQALEEAAALSGVVKSKLIRDILHNYVTHLRDAERKQIDRIASTKGIAIALDLDDIMEPDDARL